MAPGHGGHDIEIVLEALDAVVAHAWETWPRECCGLLIGGARRIESVHRARNLDPSPCRFLIDPRDHFLAIRLARASKREVVGFYHSHPSTPAEPSPRDRDEASFPGHLYFIASLATDRPIVRVFRLDETDFVELPLTEIP